MKKAFGIILALVLITQVALPQGFYRLDNLPSGSMVDGDVIPIEDISEADATKPHHGTLGDIRDYFFSSSSETSRDQVFFTERADHVGAPLATEGRLWVRNDIPNVLVFTDDAGTDTVLGSGGGGGGDMLLGSTQTNSGAKTFLDTSFLLRNVANTFNGSFVNTNTADRIYTLQDAAGTLAFTSDITGTNSGTNTGDQTSIVGITGTKAEFDTAVTDGNFMYIGDAPTSHTHLLAAGATDVTATATEVNLLDLSGLTVGWVLSADGAGSASWKAPTGGGDMVLASAQTNSGIKTFLNTTMKLRNVANTFDGYFVNTNTADRIYTLQDAAGTLAFTSDITGTNSGTNTGDQTITLTGDVTGSGTGSFAATIAANSVALSTDTTGNYVGTVAGTTNEIDVSGADTENATKTLSLPSVLDLGGKTSFELPNGAAPVVNAFGELAGDNDLWAASRGAPVFYDGTAAVALVGTLVSDAPANGQVPKWNTGGTITWENDSTGGTPALTDVTDPVGDVAFGFDINEEIEWSYTGAFTTGNQFAIIQQTGNPTGGTLLDVRAADTDVTVFAAGDGTNGIVVSQAGALTATGTGAITATGVAANSVALTTDTTGNYAAGDGEAGAALTGDSATGFFSTGTIASAQLDTDTMHLGVAQTVSGVKTFLDTTMKLRNVANTFDGYFVNTNTADRIYTLQDAAGTLAFTSDITGTNSGTNTGDEDQASINALGITSVGTIATGVWNGTVVDHERGGLEADVSGYGNGLFGTNGTATIDVDTEAELETALGSLDVVTVTSDDITSANLASLVNGETGSGAVVFGTSPTFTTDFTLTPVATPTTNTDGQIAIDIDAWGTGFDAIEFFNGTASAYVVATTSTDTPTNGQVPKWNTGGTITWEDDNSGGAPTFDTIADAAAASTIGFDDTETVTINSAEDAGTFWNLHMTDIAMSGTQTSFLIDSLGNNDTNWVPFLIQDDSGGTPDDLFKVDYAGNVSAAGVAVPTISSSNILTNKTIDGDNNTLSNLDIGNEVDWPTAGDVTDNTGFDSGDKLLIQEAGVGLRKIDRDDLPGITESETFTIMEPDIGQGISDDIVLKKFIAEKYPNGITVTSIHIDASAAYTSETFLFEHWDDASGTTQATVESITATSISTEDDGTLTDATIPADYFLTVNLDDTPEDVAYVAITISWTID